MTQGANKTVEECPSEDLKSNTRMFGKGANAYVLKLKQDFSSLRAPPGCKGKKGEILKAFMNERWAREAGNTYLPIAEHEVTRECGIAGLADTDLEECIMQSTCVHVEEGNAMGLEGNCVFLRLLNGGQRDLETCILEGKGTPKTPLSPAELLELALAATDRAICMHTQSHYHGDYQWKNLMTDVNCNPDSLKIIDLDTMSRFSDFSLVDPNDVWSPGRRVLWDYAKLFGVLQAGPFSLEKMLVLEANEVDEPKIKLAETITSSVEEAVGSHARAPEMYSPEMALQVGIDIKNALEGIRAQMRPRTPEKPRGTPSSRDLVRKSTVSAATAAWRAGYRGTVAATGRHQAHSPPGASKKRTTASVAGGPVTTAGRRGAAAPASESRRKPTSAAGGPVTEHGRRGPVASTRTLAKKPTVSAARGPVTTLKTIASARGLTTE